jgi:thiosulfate reductase cytochrome b subunit
VTRPQPLLIRITHWVNVPVFFVMAMSGLQILAAYPYFGPQGEDWAWVPLHGWIAPEILRAGTNLAGARHLHFLFMWLLVGNAVFYVVYLFASGAYKQRLKRPAYTGCLVVAGLEVLSGFAIWKPVQLWWLAAMFGGYDGARVVHWLALLALVAFTIVHVVLVLRRPKTIVEMVTGGPK